MAINYERNKKYFKESSPKAGIILIIVGLLLTILLPDAGKIVGILGVLGGGALLYFVFAGKPADTEIDRDAAEAVADVRRRALAKLGLDEDEVKLIDPVLIDGFYFKTISSGVQVKLGKDRVFRSSNYEGIVLFFSEHQLHAFKFQFSLTQSGEVREQTDEYFYKDVVSVSTQSETFRVTDVKGQSQTVNYEEFKLTTSGGTSITSSVRDEGAVSRTIQGARQLIREKKIA